MKFYIEIKHPTLGIIKSETYDGTIEQYEKIKGSVVNHNGDLKLDFYDDEGIYVVVKEGIVINSLIYFPIVK